MRIASKVGLTRVGTTWSPDGRASSIEALARASHRVLGPIDLLFLYVVVVAWLRARRVDPQRTVFLGTSPAHRAMALGLGLTFLSVR